MSIIEHTVLAGDAGQRIDKLLVDKNPQFSRQQVQRWIKQRLVTVNDNEIKVNYKCKAGDLIQWTLPEEKSLDVVPENIQLTIVYEDDDLVVVNKPRGMLVHPTEHETSGTLVNGLLYHYSQLSSLSGDLRPGIVHRLDKDTSGLLVIAKNDPIHEQLKEQFMTHQVLRKYEAIVHGVIPHDQGVIKAPIGRDPHNRLRMAVVDDGKYAETHFRVLQRFKQSTYVECRLITGRTHQIRVHMKYINHPLVGDTKYCRKKQTLIDGQALFAKQLSFYHPKLLKQITFTAEQPDYFKQLLQKLT